MRQVPMLLLLPLAAAAYGYGLFLFVIGIDSGSYARMALGAAGSIAAGTALVLRLKGGRR